MHYHETTPRQPLDRWVRCFWFLTDPVGASGPDAPPEPVVPDGRLEIVLHLAEPFGEVGPDGVTRRQAPTLVAGQLTRPLLLRPTGCARVVGIRFRTAAARALLALPLGELTDRVVPLGEVAPRWVEELEEAAREADPAAALERVLFARLESTGTLDGRGKAGRAPHPSTPVAVAHLARGSGVAAVARSLGVSERTLERRIRDDTGLAPKVLQRVVRFRRFYGALQAGGGESLSRAALAAGYYDQAHAGRDFRTFTGSSPAAHFREAPELAAAIMSDSS